MLHSRQRTKGAGERSVRQKTEQEELTYSETHAVFINFGNAINTTIVSGFSLVDQALEAGYTKDSFAQMMRRTLDNTRSKSAEKEVEKFWNQFLDQYIDLMLQKWDSYFKDELDGLADLSKKKRKSR